VSFCFNVGTGNLARSTVVRLLNEGKYEAAAEQFGKRNKIKGVVLAGSTRRRTAEANLFGRQDSAACADSSTADRRARPIPGK
jgi:lysozyme